MSDSTSLLDVFSEEIKKKKYSIPFSFNILDEQCGHIVENSHTNILMKLLQYKNQYGYVFLKSFLSFMEIGIQLDGGEVGFVLEKYYEGGRIDGLIYQKNTFALIIENKINGANNQERQIAKYIDGILGDPAIFEPALDEKEKKIWVCYLTKDGKEKPDDKSLDRMIELGICTSFSKENSIVEGPRYSARNYQEHILPWLKEEIQPMVMQRELVLNTGLLQYIDFIEGMMGLRQVDRVLLIICRDWLINELKKRNVTKNDFREWNKGLAEIREGIEKDLVEQLGEEPPKDNKLNRNDSDLRRYAGLLNNLIVELNDEPMKYFFDCTRFYFESNGLMENCVISHIFNYYYIQIRDASWPPSIHFEWYPLGIDNLTSKTPKLQLCLHIENPKYQEAFLQEKQSFGNKGFKLDENKKSSLSYCHLIDDKITSFPIIKMDREAMVLFLDIVYKPIDSDMISMINKVIDSVKKGARHQIKDL